MAAETALNLGPPACDCAYEPSPGIGFRNTYLGVYCLYIQWQQSGFRL